MKRTGIPCAALVLCSFLTLSLAACGQRGPLYLPEQEEPVTFDESADSAEQASEDAIEETDEETP